MGLFKCPDCGKKVSDRLASCPKCGCPFTTEMKEAATESATVESSNTIAKERKPINKKKIGIIAGICILVIIAVIVLIFVLNYKNMRIKKANEYIENYQYSEAVTILEKYKDDDDVKETYENALFMTTDEGQFILDFAQGLMERWSVSNSDNSIESYRKCVDIELEHLSKYKNKTFEDETFNSKVHEYLEALDIQSKALDYVKTDYSKYSSDWDKGYKQRTVLVSYFLSNYDVPIEEKYADTKAEFIASASAVSAQTELDNQIDAMIHENTFTKIKDSYGWQEYNIQVENKTDETFSSFQLVVNCLDADGNILDQTYTNSINTFEPGQKATFEFSTDKAPASLTWKADYYTR